MSDLVAFLTALLDEAEEVARACIADVGPTRAGEMYDDGSGQAAIDDYPSYPWGSGEAELAFMHRWHPARVLAEVEAKRRIIDEHREVRFTDTSLGIRDERVCTTCHGVLDEPTDWPDHSDWPFPLIQSWFPCRTLRLLVLPDRDHPDYDPAWAPETP